MTGYTARIGKYRPVNIHPNGTTTDEDDEPIKTKEIKNVVNIFCWEQKESHPPDTDTIRQPTTYNYPVLTVVSLEGGSTTTTSYVGWMVEEITSVTESITAVVMRDEYESDKKHTLEHYNAYGVWTEPYTDTFGNVKYPVTLLVDSKNDEHNFTRLSPMYRGVKVRFPHGQVETYGEWKRHSASVRKYDTDELYSPPVDPASESFTVITPEGTYRSVINVRCDRNLQEHKYESFALQQSKECSDVVYVSDVLSVRGGTYTVCLKREDSSAFTQAEYVTESYKFIIGVFYSSDGSTLHLLGHPEATRGKLSSGVSIDTIDSSLITDMHVKTPSGKIVDHIPPYLIHGLRDIPDMHTPEEGEITLTTTMEKENFTQLLISHLQNNLDNQTETPEDYHVIIDGYPELEPVFQNISRIEHLHSRDHLLPHEYSTSEIDVIERFVNSQRTTPSMTALRDMLELPEKS